MRLIDADALDCKLDALAKKYAAMGRYEAAKDYSFVQTVLLSAPTIDPESLRPKGRWILTNEDYEYLTCSACGNAYYTGAETFARAQDHLTYAGGYRYCPNCGAKMEG